MQKFLMSAPSLNRLLTSAKTVKAFSVPKELVLLDIPIIAAIPNVLSLETKALLSFLQEVILFMFRCLSSGRRLTELSNVARGFLNLQSFLLSASLRFQMLIVSDC